MKSSKTGLNVGEELLEFAFGMTKDKDVVHIAAVVLSRTDGLNVLIDLVEIVDGE